MLNLIFPFLFPVQAQNITLLSPVSMEQTLSSRSISMSNRYPVDSVNTVFKDNILLAFSYLEGEVMDKSQINWDEVNSDDHYEFILNPGEQFAFHDLLWEKYAHNVVKTTNSHFNFTDGYKTSGALYGDGVCQFASLIYWAAKDAGLEAVAPANHDFRAIPDVPREYGVSIHTAPSKGKMQNLYITNNLNNPIKFVFDYTNGELTVSVKSQRN